jgi:hypothetical protein
MTKQKFLSKKKKAHQSISIPSSLRQEIIKYINKNHEKFPNDKRFSSISAFHTHVMEKAMKCFEQGKSLDDFEWFTDKKMVSFYEPFTFKALKPLYEMITKNNRYTSLDFEAPLGFFLNLKRFARKALKNKDLNKFKAFITRFEIYFAKKEITSNLNF